MKNTIARIIYYGFYTLVALFLIAALGFIAFRTVKAIKEDFWGCLHNTIFVIGGLAAITGFACIMAWAEDNK